MKTVYYALNQPEERRRMAEWLKKESVQGVLLRPEMRSWRIADLTKNRVHSTLCFWDPLPDFILCGGFLRKEVFGFLDELNRVGLGQTAMKAVITPVNLFWTLDQLLSVCAQERQAEQVSKENRG